MFSGSLIPSSKYQFLGMPPELQNMIAGNLDALSFYNLKLVCKGVDIWTKDPPKLSALEWQQYHSTFETSAARRRRKLQTVGCAGCKKLLDRGLFSDTAIRHTLEMGRLCISCAIKEGSHDKRIVKLKGEKFFGCRGCQKAKPLDEEDECLVDTGRWFEHFAEVDRGSFSASRGRRWCRNCWPIIMNYCSLDTLP